MRSLFLIIMLLAASAPKLAGAISLTPQYVELEPLNNSGRTFRVQNKLRRLVLVAPEVQHVQLGDDGHNFSESPDLIVFPPAAEIEPGQTQVFRIFWAGGPDHRESQLYRFSVSASGFRKSGEGNLLSLTFDLGAFVAVSPIQGKPYLTTERFWIDDDAEHGRMLRAIIRNSGARHQAASLSKISLVLRDENQRTVLRKTVNGADYYQHFGVGYIAPGRTQQIAIPLEKLLSPSKAARVQSGEVEIITED